MLTSALVCFAAMVPGRLYGQKISNLWIFFILQLLKVLCGVKWEVQGAENIPDTPCIIASNHQGPWESLYLQTLCMPTSSIIKREILSIPFFGWAIAMLHPIAINRKNKMESLRNVISIGDQRLKDGYSVLIFPEGTRRRPESGIGKFGSSCGQLSLQTGIPVIPICHNSGKFWLNKSIIKKSGIVKVVIGDPIYGVSAREISEKAFNWIEKSYKNLD